MELAANYHIAESNVNRTIKKVEDALMKSRRFTLPKRSITTADEQFNWVIIDATECSIERPKKIRVSSTVVKEETYAKSTSDLSSEQQTNHRARYIEWQSA